MKKETETMRNNLISIFKFCEFNEDAIFRIPKDFLDNELTPSQRNAVKTAMNSLIEHGYLAYNGQECVAFPYVCTFTRKGIELICRPSSSTPVTRQYTQNTIGIPYIE